MYGAYTAFFMEPLYTSTSSILVLSKETTLTSIADLQLGSQLAADYQVLIKSTSVMEDVIEALDLDMTAEDLRESISVNNPEDTRILEVSVVNTDGELAKKITDKVVEISSEYIGDKMEVVPPKIIEKGKIPHSADFTKPEKEHSDRIPCRYYSLRWNYLCAYGYG